MISTAVICHRLARPYFSFRSAGICYDIEEIASDTNGLCALYKPHGILSHPNPGGRADNCLIRKASFNFKDESYTINKQSTDSPTRTIWLLNRLDSATSGLILVATNVDVAAAVKAAFKMRSGVHKEYLALVLDRTGGDGSAKFGGPFTWRNSFIVEKQSDFLRAREAGPEDAKHLVKIGQTHGKVLGRSYSSELRQHTCLLSLNPVTGYTHQLRFQCAANRMPILGDRTYGDFSTNRKLTGSPVAKILFLHSHKIDLTYYVDGIACTFSATSPMPQEFEAYLKNPSKNLKS